MVPQRTVPALPGGIDLTEVGYLPPPERGKVMVSPAARKRTVTHNGITYKVRSDKIPLPDLDAMDGTAANTWLTAHAYPRGHGRTTTVRES